jgi:predicted acetyltransferase
VSIDIRLLTADDDLEPELDLAARAFGPYGAQEREQRLTKTRATVGAGQYLAAFDGSAQVASAKYFDMRQWWHGRSLAMAGVAGVKVAPEEQGRGVGRALMTGLLEQMAARGYPLSALYPATSSLYRSLGWEMAGGQYAVTMPSRSLRSLLPPDPLAQPPAAAAAAPAAAAIRRAGPADVAEMIALEGDLHASRRDCGPVTYDAQTLAGLIDDPDIYCYLAPDGQLAYQWDRGNDELLVYAITAGSAPTARALWSIVASHGTMVKGVRAFVDPADPVSWLVRDPDVILSRPEMWMLRLIDAPAAIAGRGFPGGPDLTVALALQDAQLPANSGQWLLELSGGKGSLVRFDNDSGPAAGLGPALRLGSRGLAALYAGTSLATLRIAGLATGGDPGGDAALDDAFACTAYMQDYF